MDQDRAETRLNALGRQWIEVARRGIQRRVRPVLYEPLTRQQGPQNRTELHQPPRIPGGGDFLPGFLPKQAAQRS